jgi:hypothetical protein
MCTLFNAKPKILHSAIELHHTLVTATTLELLLEATDIDRLARGERRKSKRQREERSTQNQSQVHGHDHARTRTQPVRLLQTNEDKRRQDHDGRGVQDARDGCFAYGEGCGFLALAETLEWLGVWVGLALGALGLGEDGVDVDSAADFLAAHEEDVESGGGGDGGEGDEAGEDEAGVGGDTLQAGDESIQAYGDGAGR